MTQKYRIWTSRKLSLQGKVLISKTYGAANLIYGLTMTIPGQNILKMTQRETNNFIWSYKHAK